MRTKHLVTLVPGLLVLSACDQCLINNDDLTQLKDAGFPETDAGPPPPEFPLKAGDQLTYAVLGGRTATCDGSVTPGDCQRTLKATFIIDSVELNAQNRWIVNADFVYEANSSNLINAAAIAPLILENGAPFDQIQDGDALASDRPSAFTTSEPATDQLTALGFPFFQYESDNAGEGSVFAEAGTKFCDRYGALDADANCEIQAADQKFEVFYKDTQASAAAKLHKVREEFHEMGFICGWDEGLVPFEEGVTPRDQNGFGASDTPDLAAVFFQPKLNRDGVDYTCSCFTQQCKAGNGAEATCLTTDPDAEPVLCSEL